MKRRREEERGFVLLGVLLVLIVVVVTLTTTMKMTSSGQEEASKARNEEMIRASIDHGLARALSELQTMDPADLIGADTRYDIFQNWQNAQDFVPPMSYPPNGPFANELDVRVGLAPAQRTRAPAGEDARSAYGVIVDVQISVRMDNDGSNGGTARGRQDDAEERVSIGVRIPANLSHAH